MTVVVSPTSIIVILVDTLLHTDEQPVCTLDDTCPCHRDPDLLASVQDAIATGLLTPDEAQHLVMGRLLWQGVPLPEDISPQRPLLTDLEDILSMPEFVLSSSSSPSFSVDPLCSNYGHFLRAAWTAGEFFCTWCGVKWYCSRCLSSPPPATARVTLCRKHRPNGVPVQHDESEDEV